MEILVVVFCNIAFLVAIYLTLSRKITRVEERKLPAELESEMDLIITTFNRTADRNIDLLDDRIRDLEPLVERAEKLAEQLDGLIKRAEALGKLREMVKPRAEVPESGEKLVAGSHVTKAYRQETPPKKATPAKKPRARKKKPAPKTQDELILEMTANGKEPSEIAYALGIPREEVILKQKFARLD